MKRGGSDEAEGRIEWGRGRVMLVSTAKIDSKSRPTDSVDS